MRSITYAAIARNMLTIIMIPRRPIKLNFLSFFSSGIIIFYGKGRLN